MDLRDLIPLIGGASGLGGNPHAGQGFLQGWMQAKQQHDQHLQQQQETERQKTADKRAADELKLRQDADARAQQDQYLQGVNSIRQLLGDQTIDTPEEYGQREAFVMGMAPKLGVDTGFVQSLRPKPTEFTRRKIQKVYDKFEKMPEAERLQFE